MLLKVLFTAISAILGYFLYSGGYRIFWRYIPARRFHPALPYLPYGQAEILALSDKPFDQTYESILQHIVIPSGNQEQSFLQRYFGLHLHRQSDKTIKELGLSVPPLFMLWLFGKANLVIADPALIKEVACRPSNISAVLY
jgi:hypothetical protein